MPSVREADAGASKSKASDQAVTPPLRLPGVPLMRIFFQGDRDASQGGSSQDARTAAPGAAPGEG